MYFSLISAILPEPEYIRVFWSFGELEQISFKMWYKLHPYAYVIMENVFQKNQR
jgi:hypothetical protein